MRAKKAATAGSLRAQAIAGNHVVTLGLNMKEAETDGLLGFGIHRTDKTENEAYWLEGQKRFQLTDPGLPPGSGRSRPSCSARRARNSRLPIVAASTSNTSASWSRSRSSQ